jgi:rod shape-determining protein MreD
VIVTRRIALRLALILLVSVVLQLSFFSFLSFFGATPDVLMVVIACLGLLGGAMVGAVCGFAAGILLDSALLQALGVSSLALLAVGYLTGRYREGFEVSGRMRPALVIGGATLVGTAIFAALQIMLGVSTPVSLLVLREILVKGFLGFLMAFAFYPILRQALRAALVDEPRPGRIREHPPITATVASRRRPRPRSRSRRAQARPLSGVGGRI